jgi:MFS transporter, AAHS family, 3-hydroxyphenylpropionic acid transporter
MSRVAEPIVQPTAESVLHSEPVEPSQAVEESEARIRATVRAIVATLYYQGFAMSINGIGAPWIARDFGLGQSGIARLFAWISPSALGALALSRMIDRIGRKRVLLWCVGATSLSALGAAVSTWLPLFIVFEILLYAFAGATISAGIVMLAEELPIERRARGQSYGGLGIAFGGGVCVLLMPVLVHFGLSWRWLLVLAGAGLVLVPIVARVMPESRRWENAAASGKPASTHFYDVFVPLYRSRSVTLIACSLMSSVAVTAANSWSYYHAVSVVGLSAAATSALVILGGGVGLIGFAIGAWTAERFGRVPTIVIFGIVSTCGWVFFYWGPPAHFAHPAVWLGAGFAWSTLAGNAGVVAANAAVTELFPTALRGTMAGWFSLTVAIGAVSAQGTIALLAGPLGGLSRVVGYLAMLGVPAAALFGVMIPETRGLSLEAAAMEEEFSERV